MVPHRCLAEDPGADFDRAPPDRRRSGGDARVCRLAGLIERQPRLLRAVPPDLGLKPGLNVDLEPEIDLGRGHAAANAPVLGTALAKQDFDVVGRDAELPEIVNNPLVQGALCLE